MLDCESIDFCVRSSTFVRFVSVARFSVRSVYIYNIEVDRSLSLYIYIELIDQNLKDPLLRPNFFNIRF